MMPLSCFFFAIYPILFLWQRNWEEVFASEVLLLTSIVLASTIVMYQIAKLLLPTVQKAKVATLLFLVMFVSFDHFFYFYSPMFQFLYKKQIFGFVVGRYAVLLPVWAGLFVCLLFLISKTKKDLASLLQLFTVISSALVLSALFPLSHLMYSRITAPVLPGSPQELKVSSPLAKRTSTVGYLPNIYYIILDEYARNDALKALFDFDNNGFLNALKDQGFFVADKSCSNYTKTYFSLPSSLTSTYINTPDHFSPYEYLNGSNIIKFLQRHGYKYIHVSSGVGFTRLSPLADRQLIDGNQYPFSRLFLGKTFFGPFFELFKKYIFKGTSYSGGYDGQIKLDQFQAIKEIAENENDPVVLFCHVMCPHRPFIFDKDGNLVETDDTKKLLRGIPLCDVVNNSLISTPENKQLYVEQIRGLNKHIINLVQTILSKSKDEPIIILQADHGQGSADPEYFWLGKGKLSDALLKERLGIFNAYHFPHGGNEKLYSAITPVNSLRVLCNHYFNTDLELLEDMCHWSICTDPFNWTQYTPEHINTLSWVAKEKIK